MSNTTYQVQAFNPEIQQWIDLPVPAEKNRAKAAKGATWITLKFFVQTRVVAR